MHICSVRQTAEKLHWISFASVYVKQKSGSILSVFIHPISAYKYRKYTARVEGKTFIKVKLNFSDLKL